VKQAASESWAAYKTHAWGHDELVADDGSRDWLYLQVKEGKRATAVLMQPWSTGTPSVSC
jgi:hypothetical protein